LIGLLKGHLKLRGSFIHLLQFSVALDNIIGVVLFGLIMLLVNNSFKNDMLIILLMIGSLLFSVFLAWIFFRVSKIVNNLQQFFLILIGFLLIIVGVALNLNLSVLLSSFIFGVALSNLPVDTRKLYHSITNAEKPLYYLMLILIGASIGSIEPRILYIIFIVVLYRFLLKYVVGNMARYSIKSGAKPDHRIGLPQIGMGGIAMAMVFDFHLSVDSQFSQNLLFFVSVMVILNALLSSVVFKILKTK
jgi:Kef-type K+ transport system membrane component KefB